MKELQDKLAERTSDLQRLQAEYVNYKRRVDRDRDLARKVTIEGVIKDFLSVLDDVRSAREHDELSGGFKAVAEEIERVTSKYGLETFGEAGDPFNPHIHEALLHAHAEGIEGPTCVEILQPGYRIGNRILRPARVAVAEPEPELMGPEAEPMRPGVERRMRPEAEPMSHEAEPMSPEAEPMSPEAEPMSPEAEPMSPEAEPMSPEPVEGLRTAPVEPASSSDEDAEGSDELVEATGEPGADKPDADADQR